MTEGYYKSYVARYRILRHEELPQEHKDELIANGEDPGELWGLIWSFEEKEHAEDQLEACRDEACSFQTYKLVDNGEASVIERPIY